MSYGQRIFTIVPDSTTQHTVEAAKLSSLGPLPQAPVRDQLQRVLKDLRVSVIDQCNFRCTYCMPKEVFDKDYEFLDRSALLSFDEIERLTKSFIALGIDKLRMAVSHCYAKISKSS